MQKSNLGNIRLTFEELVKILETCCDRDRELILKKVRKELERREKLKEVLDDIKMN